MRSRIIDFSLRHPFLILAWAIAMLVAGIYALRHIPITAIPSIANTQVILYATWPGQTPQIVEDQLTSPITRKLLFVPRAQSVHGEAFYGCSLIHLSFEEGTDPDWARSRVLEQLMGLGGTLPRAATISLGPNATDMDKVFLYALESKTRSLDELRALQDGYFTNQLSSVPGVAEVASLGGFVKQYQVTVDPLRLAAYHLTLFDLKRAIEQSSGAVGAGSIESGEQEFLISVPSTIQGVDDIRKIAVGPHTLGDVADVAFGPAARRGIAELDGQGETVAGIVIVRHGANVPEVIANVKKTLDEAMIGLGSDVRYTVTYDQTALIEGAIGTLERTLIAEGVVIILVFLLFLWHFRSAFIALITIPLAILGAFLILYVQGSGANILSFGGIAIAVTTMINAVIVMVERAHHRLEREGTSRTRLESIRDAALDVGPTLFCSLLVITISFLPVITLHGQEGRLVRSLAFTEAYAMLVAALLSITLVPILMKLFIRGHITPKEKNPLSRGLTQIYRVTFECMMEEPRAVLVVAGLLLIWAFFPWDWLITNRLPQGPIKHECALIGTLFPTQHLGSEFVPPLYEGDLVYRATTMGGIGITEARVLVQQQDRIIASFGEVKRVFGKVGRAETALDSAQLNMIETIITLKDRDKWPRVDILDQEGKVIAHRKRTPHELIQALTYAVSFPGVTHVWSMPIREKIDRLTKGALASIGIKVTGQDPEQVARIINQIEAVIRTIPGTATVFAERLFDTNYFECKIDREAIARYQLTVKEVQEAIELALGGPTITTTVDGPITLQYARDFRDSFDAIKEVLIPTLCGAQMPLRELAHFEITRGPATIKTENGVPSAWIYVDVGKGDVDSYVATAKKMVTQAEQDGTILLTPGSTISWNDEHVSSKRLWCTIPLTLLIVATMIWANTRSAVKTAMVLIGIPFTLGGAFWALHAARYHLSGSVWVGLIAISGVDAETGVIMLLSLERAFDALKKRTDSLTVEALQQAIFVGAAKRVRPKIMTAAVIIAGLLPLILSEKMGADLMKRIATPMVGGIIASTLVELMLYPIIFFFWKIKTEKIFQKSELY